ncbi:UDP-glycosyltransferase 92A1-like [Nicotiana tabacum]|uniref:Glycosyltransferase n=2 Tax=Nicotiana TaxID=4085 RepID=A0A1S4D3V1_TOBAC|nr:PREDICTED: UDP-glycosyltransferase 92A1-like [Nicotiana sylvestris]XP_016508046.1 PREDICTED: UDP-glycosyltransferase 92A1-like [Nicotiana tabacum]
MEGKKGNIILFPFMAQGHIIPFLALAFKLEQKGYQITFINTPLNIKKLKSSLPTKSSIHFLEIPFDSTKHGLPLDAEINDSLPYNLVFKLLEISPTLEPNFKKILSDLVDEKIGFFKKPICVIADFFFGWSAKVTHEFGIFHAIFCGTSGFGLACYYSMWLNLPHRYTDKLEFILPDFQEAGKFHVTQLSPSLAIADGNDPYSIFQLKNLPTWKNSDGVLFNTVEEFDKNGLMYFRRKLCIPIWAIGPINLQENDRVRLSPRKELGISLDICKEWLDKKEKKSVLYICFGAQNTISASQIMQLAKALDGLEINFIWVIRPPLGFDINTEFKPEEWLPEGFIQTVQENEKRGLIVLNWAPQVEILAHESIGGFLSNCGWNSVFESLINGVPLIGWPMAADQFFNAKLLEEEIGVCVEMARGTTFDVRYGDLIEKIELVMGESEKGKRLRGKACEIKEMIKDAARDEDDYKGSSVRAMDEFFNAVLLMKERIEIGSQ